MASKILYTVFVILIIAATCSSTKYEPTWDSIDSRPLPGWYDEAKLGIFIHWGVFSVPSFESEWFWWYWQGDTSVQPGVAEFVKENYRPDWTYADFASQFTAEFYDANHWADVIKKAGAQYVVLTTKHHEGFCMWPSNYSFNWNSMQVGPKRDLVGELAQAIRSRTDIHFGLYHSMFEWFNPLYLKDKANGFKTQDYVNGKTLPELYEIVNTYKPDVVWSDGAPASSDYWKSTEFLAWLYNDSPVKDTVVVNDRWGTECPCNHGGYYTCQDHYNPGHLVNHKWENCMTIDRFSWGYRRNSNLFEYISIDDIIDELVSTVSCGGNLLLNIGPTHDGRIVPVFEERLTQLGEWMGVNGEAIYSTVPWPRAQDDNVTSNVWYTSKKDASQPSGYAVFAITLAWPDKNELVLGSVKSTPQTIVNMVGYSERLQWRNLPAGGGISVTFPTLSPSKLPCKWAWTLKLSHIVY